MIRTLRETPEIGSGSCSHVDVPVPGGVLVHRADHTTGVMAFVHNLGLKEATVDLSSLEGEAELPNDVLADRDYGSTELKKLTVAGYGYRWIRIRRDVSRSVPSGPR